MTEYVTYIDTSGDDLADDGYLTIDEYSGDKPTCPDRTCGDGYVPAGSHPAIGNLCRPCPTCNTAACGECGGSASQPTDGSDLEYFLEMLLRAGLHLLLCPGCGGLLTITVVSVEVTP
jgi:hypothetical protein